MVSFLADPVCALSEESSSGPLPAAVLHALVAAGGVREVCDALLLLVDCDWVDAMEVYLRPPDKELLLRLGARGLAGDSSGRPASIARDDGAAWRAVALGEPVVCDKALASGGEGLRSCVVVPLKVGADVFGCARLFWRGEARLDDVVGAVSLAAAAMRRAISADDARFRSGVLDALLPLMSDGVLVVTQDGDLQIYNQALEDMVGWSAEQVRARGWTNLVYPDPDVRARLQQAIAALLQGHRSEGFQRSLARAEGGFVRAAIWSWATPHPAGTAAGLVGLMKDVTDEEDARRRELRDESLSQLGRLAGGMAHDFNNLLCAIMGHAELIELKAGGGRVVAGHAGTIVDAARRGADLCRQLLAFSGVSNTRPAAVGPVDEVGRIVELFRSSLPPGVGLSLEIAEGTPAIEVDPAQLHQALMNLLVNARDAIGVTGQIVLRVDQAALPGQLHLRSAACPDAGVRMVRLVVEDSGPGFGADALRHLFEPFFTTKAEGHGVGLPAVHGIVAAHGGGIRVIPGAGAKVELYLPISRRPELALEPQPVLPSRANGQRVWVVDDQTQVLEFSRIALAAAGYQVSAFAAESEALGAAMAQGAPGWPDLLILDVIMPDGGGPGLLAALRSVGVAAPVVWTSGYTPETAGLNLVDGDQRFLQKPYTGRDLVAAVQRVLDDPRSS